MVGVMVMLVVAEAVVVAVDVVGLVVGLIEGSLEVKLPTIWRNGKAEVGRVREEKKRSEKIREERRCRCAKR